MSTYTEKQIFKNMNQPEGKSLLSIMMETRLSQVQIQNTALVENLIAMNMAGYMDLEALAVSKRSKGVMAELEEGGLPAVAKKIVSYIQENPEDSLADWFYHISLFVSLQTLSGYIIDGTTQGADNPNRWFFKNRQNYQDIFIRERYQEAINKCESFLMVLPEGDAGPEAYPQTMAEKAQFLQLNGGFSPEETPHTDEHAVSIIYSPDLRVEELPHEQVGFMISSLYGEEAKTLLAEEGKVITVIKFTNKETGEYSYGIIGHPKSFGSFKDLKRNRKQMRLIHMMKDVCLYHKWPVIVLGDFNTPINAPTGTLHLTQEELDSLPLAEKEGWFSACLRKLGLTSKTATVNTGLFCPEFNQEDIPTIERSGNVCFNSQVFKGKMGTRCYLRDGIFPSWGYESNPTLEIYPKRKDTPIIPTVGNATSGNKESTMCWSSDHPYIDLTLNTSTWALRVAVFNRLANSSLGKDTMPEDASGYLRDIPKMFEDIWKLVVIEE